MNHEQLETILKFTRAFNQGRMTAFLSLCWVCSQHGKTNVAAAAKVAMGHDSDNPINESNMSRNVKFLVAEKFLTYTAITRSEVEITVSSKGMTIAQVLGFDFDYTNLPALSSGEKASNLIKFCRTLVQSKMATIVALFYVLQSHDKPGLKEVTSYLKINTATSKSLTSNTSRNLKDIESHGYIEREVSYNKSAISLTAKGAALAKALGFVD